MDIPIRLHVRRNMKYQKFFTIQEIDICETTWYKIVGLLRSTYMLYKANSKRGCRFLPQGHKSPHKF
jgi:hypothetical protein